MDTHMQASWRKMVGIALLWFALAALAYVPTSSLGAKAATVAFIGFVSFSFGISLLMAGFKRDLSVTLKDRRSE